MSDLLNQRTQQILKILVERYIQDGNPVASKTIAEDYALGLSPATIRNILSELEEAGYLASPHTSAGRIPTEMGYRLFVNSLLTIKPLESTEVSQLKAQLDPDLAVPSLLQSASSLLSNLTQLVGVVTTPKRNRIELRHVEFLPLSANRVLVILVLNDREVQNRIIYTDRAYSDSELTQAANYLNAEFAGKTIETIRQELLDAIQSDRQYMDNLLQAAIDVANKALVPSDANHADYVIAGQNNLVNFLQTDNLERIRELLAAFTQKQEILRLLDYSLAAEGIQIFIGKESGYKALGDCSIVTSSYAVDGQLVGSLGIIGPTRMPYERVIAAVDITAKLLSAALVSP